MYSVIIKMDLPTNLRTRRLQISLAQSRASCPSPPASPQKDATTPNFVCHFLAFLKNVFTHTFYISKVNCFISFL